MIKVKELKKTYGGHTAVDNMSFTIPDGAITGFLGPNGAGKSTTMRMILGLDNPDHGTALIDGQEYSKLDSPLKTVGTLLDAKAVHPNRTALSNLRIICKANGIKTTRAMEVLDMVGLKEVANKKVGGFSLGMHQRLGLASSLLGDPKHIILDEPGNGLDPEGIRWVRNFLKHLSQKEGKSVFISSHQLLEISEMADHLVIIGSGEMKYNNTMEEFYKEYGDSTIKFVSPEADQMHAILEYNDIKSEVINRNELKIYYDNLKKIGNTAFQHKVPIHELSNSITSLEDAYFKLTSGSAQYVTGGIK